jgi:hypothetical protein
MRTLATISAVSIAAMLAAGSAFAWTKEQPAKQDATGQAAAANAADLSDNDAFQALQDKVNGKTQSQSGFQITTGTGSAPGMGLSGANPYGVAPTSGSSAFSYSPNPGFRGYNR